MKRNVVLTLLASGLLVSCAYNTSYRPANRPEKMEFGSDHRDVYPEDVRNDPALYAKLRVAWAGVIVSNSAADEDSGGKIGLDTVFEHHYCDWQVDEGAGSKRLLISPRGEGRFRMHWELNRKDVDATSEDALRYARPGRLAVVYASPESVDDDGTIVVHYRYVRILGPAHFTRRDMDYGRQGEPYHPVDASAPGTAAIAPSH
jgi:hypothetical protein